jgi:uncharacterized protein (DUF1778 family)
MNEVPENVGTRERTQSDPKINEKQAAEEGPVSCTFRVDKDVLRCVDKAAAYEDRSRNNFIKTMLMRRYNELVAQGKIDKIDEDEYEDEEDENGNKSQDAD